jgi:murein L,D-transpeptidase YafK
MKASIAPVAAVLAGLFLAGCNGTFEDLTPKAEKQLPQKVVNVMKAKGMTRTSPIMVRIFKEEGTLEVWKQKDNGRYDLVTNYEICKWSGKLGPKFTEGDRQAPEGFYTVRPGQMNPKSSYHLAFNIGFPNAYDQAHGRSGRHLMVHGACSSSGCYSMTDESVEQIYAFARDAFRGGQTEFQIQAFPFRMTPENMARYRNDRNYEFWTMLKEGYDHFEITKVPPKVDVCGKRYVFNSIAEGDARMSATAACPPLVQPQALATAYQSYRTTYEAAFSAALNGGRPAPKPTIAGIQEAKLVADWSKRRARGERVSREPPSLGQPETAVARAEPAQPAARDRSPFATAVAGNDAAPAPASTATPAAVADAPAAAPPARQSEPAVAAAPAPAPRATGEAAPVIQATADAPSKERLGTADAPAPQAFAPVSALKKRLLGMFGS